ncbi:hypothetical protein BH10CYA1_BH10CYA1_32150 [soil metagenome]
MQHHFRLSTLSLALATLMLSACHQDQTVLREVLPNTTTNIETNLGLEVQVKAPDGTLVEKHFPLSDGRGHNFYHEDSGALAKSLDEYLSAKPRSNASWTPDGKVQVGRVLAENGDCLIDHELLDSGATKTTYRLDAQIRAEAQRTSDGVRHWIWYQGVGPSALKWFEEEHTGTGESLKLVSLDFFRPNLDRDAQVVRECSLIELPDSESRSSVNAVDVTFYREDGVTADFRQHWLQDKDMEEGLGAWTLDKVDELDETGTAIVRSIELRDGGSDSVEIISVTDWPDTDRTKQRRYGSVYGTKSQTLVETWSEDGVQHDRLVCCAAQTTGRIEEDALSVGNADPQPEPDLAPSHFTRFRGDLRNGVVTRLLNAVNKSRSQDEVASLRWYDVEFP